MSQIKFGEIAEFRNGLNFSKDSHGIGCLLIGVPDFRDRFTPNYKSVGEINPTGIAKDDDYLQKGDILFVRSNGNKNLVGRSLYIDTDVKALFSGFSIRARMNSDKISPLFCAYFTRTNRFRKLISALSEGTNIQNLNQGILSNVRLPLFSREEQDSITKILSNLDKKIEINNRINTEIESMAKLLYDYWFIQHDFPDKNGNPYKSSGGKMIYNKELKREIPAGWDAKKLVEIEPNIITGKTPPKINPEYFNGKIPFITIGDIRGNLHVIHTDETLTPKGANFQKNKYINKGAICVTCIASPGLVGFSSKLSQTNQQINSIECNNVENKYYLYFSLIDFFRYSKAKTGSTFPNMNKGDFSSILTLKPERNILKTFHEKIESSIDLIFNNSLENEKLIELRDWLLPMLMNGQVRVG